MPSTGERFFVRLRDPAYMDYYFDEQTADFVIEHRGHHFYVVDAGENYWITHGLTGMKLFQDKYSSEIIPTALVLLFQRDIDEKWDQMIKMSKLVPRAKWISKFKVPIQLTIPTPL